MKNLLLLLFILFPSISQATTLTYGTTYAPSGQVTSTNLNGNFANVSNVVNGNLDNTNANTTAGYHFFQTVAALPAAGSQGSTYFLTSDNSLNLDTGSAFAKAVTIASPVNGDTVYYNSGWNRLAVGTNGQVIASNGTLPTYQNISSIVSLIPQANILSYGTSASSSSTIAPANFKVAFGNVSIAATSDQNITNLLFTSSSTYSCTANIVATNAAVSTVNVSGSTVTLHNNDGSTRVTNWICMGS